MGGKLITLPTPARTPGAARLRRAICAAGLTQQQAGELIGRDGRQIRKWLRKCPPVLELLVELEARARRVA